MKSSFEQTLIDVWRQALVENARVVVLGTERYPVRLTPKRRLRQVAKLRRQNCFDQLVKKLVDGESAAAAGRWLHALNPEGEGCPQISICAARTT
jgi:hypothetical protein